MLFIQKEEQLTIDGFPTAVYYDECGQECMLCTNAGTIWFATFFEKATIKIKSCHSPFFDISAVDFKYVPPQQFQIDNEGKSQLYSFDQNYMIGSTGRDGIIKLWNMYDSEFQLQFNVPKEECVALTMH